jgi:hypothetical protein
VKLKISVYKSIAIANKEVPEIIYLQIKLFICTTITGDADKVIGKFSASLNYYYL